MNIIFRVLKIVTIFILSLGTFAHAEATPPNGESLLQWHFGVTPTLDTSAFNNSAGYNDGSGANGGYPFNLNSLIPTKHMDTADYTISDWFGSWDKDFGFTNISGLYPSGGEWYDVEALYLDNDEDYIYVSVITSASFKDTNLAGNDANKTIGIVDPRLDTTTAFIRPGDLSISLLKNGTARKERANTTWNYNYGLDLIDDVRPNNDNSNEYTVGRYYKTQYIRSETLQKGLYATTSDLPDTASNIVYPTTGDWYTGSRVGHVDAYYELTHFDPAGSSSQFSGAYKGDASYVNYSRYTFPSGHEENNAETWVIEAIIPKALFGADITGQAQQVMAIRWTMGCRNDGANEDEGGPFPIIQLKATLDKKDWGDLPDADGVSNSNGANYNTDATGTVGASHVIVNNLHMGSTIDKELEGQPSALADGDDTVAGDDEDGVVFSEFIAGRDAEVNATVFNNSGLDATLYWFIDFNGDGDFLDASESDSVVVASSNSAQEITLTIPVPTTANIGASLGARFRLSTETTLTANGAAKDGEVEDYLIEVIAKLSIGSLIWEDLNGNGLQDDTDVGIEDVNVTLLDENGIALASPAMLTTLVDGKYYFSGLDEGRYSVRVSPPTGMGYVPCRVQTQGENDTEDDSNIASNNGNEYQSAQFSLQANTEPTEGEGKVGDDADDTDDENGNMTVDFCFYRPASLGNYVWYDDNKDGQQEFKESGVPDINVTLLKDCNPNTIVSTIITDSEGKYLFSDLDAGDYCVEFSELSTDMMVTKKGTESTTTDSDASQIAPYRTEITTLDAGENDLSWDMGIYSNKVTIGDLVWYDLNENGQQDGLEGGVLDITVKLYDENCNNELNSTTTDGNGKYLFESLTPATYCLEFTGLKEGYVITTQDSGNNETDSDVNASTGKTVNIVLAEGVSDLSWDMGIYKPASLGDYVWNDKNANGLQDGDEVPVSGIDVTLLGSDCATPVVGVDPQATDVNGSYLFTDLVAGEYCVEFSNIPLEYAITPQGKGDDTRNSDVNVSSRRTDLITLNAGDNIRTVDMGIYEEASLGNYVWNDVNANGEQEGAEAGVSGVTVTLYKSDCITVAKDNQGIDIDPKVTEGNGLYKFEELMPSEYCVGFSTLPLGYGFTPQNNALDDLDSDVDVGTGEITSIVLDSGENDMTLDAGIFESAAIGDKVWYDKNANGIQDVNESGVLNVEVILYKSDCTTVAIDGVGTSIPSTNTLADGSYHFRSLVPNDYCVGFNLATLPSGYKVSPQKVATTTADKDSNANSIGKTESTTLLGGQDDTSWDMGIYKPASMGNFIWLDEDADGVQDVNESGVANVSVTLYKSDCETAVTTDDEGNAIASVLTGANGIYGFSNLTPSTYCIGFESLPFHHVITSINQGSDLLDSDVNVASKKTIATVLESGENDQSWDMGVYEPASIGSKVWLDSNADGIQDANETGVENVTVTLYASDCITVVSSKTTDGSGIYEFKSLTPSEYCIGFTVPNGYLVSPPDVGNDNSDSDINLDTYRTISTKLSSGEHDLSWDMGIFKPASIGNRVWNDVNANGIQDTNESGVQNVSITLLKGDCISRATDRRGVTIPSVLTDIGGLYSFNNLQSNDYCVGFTVPNGFVVSPKNSVADIDLDSDVNSDSNTTDATILSMDENDSSWDMGIYKPVSIGNYVWLDNNLDGVQDANESGVPDINVTLYEADCSTEVRRMVTGSHGEYLFANLVPNGYCLGFDLPTGYAWTTKNSADDAKDSDVDRTTNKTVSVNLPAGSNDLSWDAGLYQLSSLGDFVWYDDVKNGIQDANETGVADMNVTLYTDCNTSRRAIQNTTTDSNGFYLFSNLEPNDDYCIGFDNLPDGYQFTVDPEHNLSSTLECIVDTSTGITQDINLPHASNDLRWDMGIIPKCLDEEGRHLEIHDDAAVASTVGSVTTINILANDFGNLDIESIKFVKTTEGAVYHSNGTAVAGTSLETYDTLVVAGEGIWRVTSNGKITFTSQTGFSGVPSPVYYIVQCKQGIISNVAQASITSNCVCETYEEKAVAAMNNYGMFLMLMLTSTFALLLFRREFEEKFI